MNVDKMEQEQQEGDDANEGEDQRLLSSYWQARFEQLEAGAARVKQLEEELEISERSKRELLEELLRTKESTSSLLTNYGLSIDEKEGTSSQAHHPTVDHRDATRLSATWRPRLEEDLVAQNSNRTLDNQPSRRSSFLDQQLTMDNRGSFGGGNRFVDSMLELIGPSAPGHLSAFNDRDSSKPTCGDDPTSKSFLEEKQEIANRGPRKNAAGSIGASSVKGGHSLLNAKVAMADRGSKGRRSRKTRATPKGTSGNPSGRVSFMNLKLAMANRRSSRKISSGNDATEDGEQTIDNRSESETVSRGRTLSSSSLPQVMPMSYKAWLP